MIGQKNDERLIQQFALIEYLEDAADLLIHVADRAIVGLTRLPNLLRGNCAMPDVIVGAASWNVPPRPIAGHRRRDFCAVNETFKKTGCPLS